MAIFALDERLPSSATLLIIITTIIFSITITVIIRDMDYHLNHNGIHLILITLTIITVAIITIIITRIIKIRLTCRQVHQEWLG